jgi:hypothetical protein
MTLKECMTLADHVRMMNAGAKALKVSPTFDDIALASLIDFCRAQCPAMNGKRQAWIDRAEGRKA